jgi:addiction module HigA family antidote
MAARVLLDCKRPPKRSSRELLLMSKKLSAVHPGEVLREEFLVPMKLSPYAVARVVGVPRTRIERLVNGQTALTADTALRLAKAFRTTPAFWMGLQAQYDIERAQDEIHAGLKKITPIVDAA